jgi:hypothetical protein
LRSKSIFRREQGRSRPELANRARDEKPVPIRALVHVTAVGIGREIIEAGQIEARRCKIFKQHDLAYFFALRPAYKLRDGSEKTDKINYFPCVFILSPDNLRDPFHVYPFDTGGAMSGKFDDKADRTIPLDDYALEPTLEAAGRHIRWAFGGLDRYLEGDLRLDVLDDVPRYEAITRGFVDIAQLASSKHNAPDRRASAVEVAYDHHIPLKGNVQLVILPKNYIEDDGAPNTALLTKLHELDIPWRTYDWQPNRPPDDLLHEIAEQVARFYREEDLA